MTRRIELLWIGAILLVYLGVAGLYAVRTPDWQAPDEPAHVNYARQIADEGILPEIEPGDWNQAYQDYLKATRFAPEVVTCAATLPDETPCPGLDAIQYEDHQPPLYYLLQAPVYAASGGDLIALRLASVLLGAGVILAAWRTLRALVPRWPVLALAGAGFVAFIPQHLAILGSVNNDALAELIAALTLWAVVRYLVPYEEGARPVSPVVLGLLAGAAMLTKTTIYFLGGIVALAVLLRWHRERWPWPVAARHLSAALVPALVMGALWWGRNLSVYGGLDFTGLERHDEVVTGQLRTNDYIEDELDGNTRLYLKNAAQTTLHSFWGQFGWMAVPMPAHIYRLLNLFALGVLAGLGLLLALRRPWTASTGQRHVLIVFAAAAALTIAQFTLYNVTFVQFQGRYLYPALIPAALIVAAGLGGWCALVEDRLPVLKWLPVLSMFGWAAFALYALETFLVPNL